MKISIKGYITSKDSELFYDCADRYAYNKSQNKFAIADGVSKSFFPKIWADVLVNKWVDSKEFDESKFILECQKNWINQVTEIVNQHEVKWFTKNGFNRNKPGLATFVGLRFYKKKKKWLWKAEALGDSFLFFVPKNINNFSKECIVISSKQKPVIFDNFPDYLSSIGNIHKGKKYSEGRQLTSGTFYLMTDALAEWFLNEKEKALNKIEVWQNQKDFEHFVDEERLNGKLENDDSAILIIKTDNDKKDKLTYVSEDVSNIEELIKVQQMEFEVLEKTKEQESILQKENSNSEISTEQIQEVASVENKIFEEVETEIEKPKKGFFKRMFVKDENKLSNEKEEIESDEKLDISEIPQEENEPSTQDEESNTEIEKSENLKNNQNEEIESKSKKEPEIKPETPNTPSQNITDKF